MDVFQWIEDAFRPQVVETPSFIYDDMDSQSGRSLPVLYEPFDAGDRWHWRDRGSLFDFLHATGGEGQRLLDFGPGDGWPSLIVAPFGAEVTGVDGSRRRVDVCTENAARLGIGNARFVFSEPGAHLPFEDGRFDGAMAASSVEQTPDPVATLRELHRVLRPGGRLRIRYEALGRYQGGQERDLWLWAIDSARCRLLLYDRDIAGERVRQYGLTYALPKDALAAALGGDDRPLEFAMITPQRLDALAPSLTDACVCTTTHPSGATLAGWLRDVGFREIRPTHSGAAAAGELFDTMPESERPADLVGVDAIVRPVAEAACHRTAPLDTDPMIIAVK